MCSFTLQVQSNTGACQLDAVDDRHSRISGACPSFSCHPLLPKWLFEAPGQAVASAAGKDPSRCADRLLKCAHACTQGHRQPADSTFFGRRAGAFVQSLLLSTFCSPRGQGGRSANLRDTVTRQRLKLVPRPRRTTTKRSPRPRCSVRASAADGSAPQLHAGGMPRRCCPKCHKVQAWWASFWMRSWSETKDPEQLLGLDIFANSPWLLEF